MTDLRTAAQQALEALDRIAHGRRPSELWDYCIETQPIADALRAALAEDALERMSEDERRLGIQLGTHSTDCWKWHHQCAISKIQWMHTPLTDAEIDRVTDAQWAVNNHKPIYVAHRAFARAIERAHGIGVKE